MVWVLFRNTRNGRDELQLSGQRPVQYSICVPSYWYKYRARIFTYCQASRRMLEEEVAQTTFNLCELFLYVRQNFGGNWMVPAIAMRQRDPILKPNWQCACCHCALESIDTKMRIGCLLLSSSRVVAVTVTLVTVKTAGRLSCRLRRQYLVAIGNP